MNATQLLAIQNLIEATEMLNTSMHPMKQHVSDVIENAREAIGGKKVIGIYHEILSDAIEAAKNELEMSGAKLDVSNHPVFSPANRGETVQGHFPLTSYKGKATRKWGHVSIYRMDSGRYEQTNYVL